MIAPTPGLRPDGPGTGVPELRVSDRLSIPLAEIDLRTSRSSGPGGQHANVTASRVEAVFDAASSSSLTEEQRRAICGRLGPRVTAVAQDTRGQARNRELALERLAQKLERALRPRRPRRATKPTRASKERRLEQKRRQSRRKRDRRVRPDD